MKSSTNKREIKFLGKTYTPQGCKPSDTKVKALSEMLKPTTLKDLQTLLGMVQYLNKFSLRIVEIAEPLRDLTKKHAPYALGPEHNHTFNSIKKDIVQAPYPQIL